MERLKQMGFGPWFQSRIDSEKAAIHDLARVIAVHRDSYTVSKGAGGVFAEVSGNLSYTAESVTGLPTTGDWVYADFFDDDTHAIVHGVLPRKSLLKRKTAGKLVDWQLIAANIDLAFIMQSVDRDFNLGRLERYLAMVNESGIEPVILLSKCDLASGQELAAIESSIRANNPQTKVVAFSNLIGHGIDAITQSLMPGQTYCLLGSSGVGKTTLLNSIVGGDFFDTQAVSAKTNKGKHTTTSRELVQLDNGAMLIDTPGMRELGSLSVDAGIDETFAEIQALSEHCKFRNCSHSNEKGCAIRAAINEGELTERRFNNYLKLKRESAFYDMSYSEKRKKDKDFGKLIKSVMQDKNRR